jgi:hypothetical protein
MTSAINPNNIDGTYPIAGQDNNTQGFRDNFTNTKTNFQFAAEEITDLQNKVVLKAALTGGTLDNNLNDALLYAATIQDFAATRVALTNTVNPTINYAAGHYQTVTPTAAFSFTVTNWPTAGNTGLLRLQITITNTAYTVTFPAAVSVNTTGIQGWASNVITFAATGTYEFALLTSNGGSSVSVFDLSRPLLGSPAAAVGYATGTGGTVTQASSKSTGVTLNKRCGQITMNNASLAAAAEVSFTLTNSFIAATDVVVASIASGATAGAYNLQVDASASGSCRISLGNKSSGSLSEAVVINFAVISAVNS